MTALRKLLGKIWGGLESFGRLVLRVAGPVVRLVGRKPHAVVIALGVVVALLAVGVGLLWNSDRGHQDEVDAREDAVSAAKENVPKVLSYDFETMDKQLEDIGPLLGDPFKNEYTEFFQTNVVPAAREQQIKTNTIVAAESVINGDADEVIALMFLNQETRTNVSPDPVLTGSRIRVKLEKHDGDWLITDLDPL